MKLRGVHLSSSASTGGRRYCCQRTTIDFLAFALSDFLKLVPKLGRGSDAGEGLPRLQPDLKLDDTVPFRLSRNHFMIEKRDGCYYVHDLGSTLGTIVNGEPIGNHLRGDDAPLQAGENEVIAGGVDFTICVLRVHSLRGRFGSSLSGEALVSGSRQVLHARRKRFLTKP
jgi:hypothetical protein